MVKVLVFGGSARKDSFNKKLAAEAAAFAKKKGAEVTLIDIKDYAAPFYDGDLEAKEGMPLKAKQLRNLMIASDIVIISSPEYNASLPAILKNAIDWASRGEDGNPSREAFKGKKYAIMGASVGKTGAGRCLVHLRQILESAGATVIEAQVTVPSAMTAFGPEGKLVIPEIKTMLETEIEQLQLTH